MRTDEPRGETREKTGGVWVQLATRIPKTLHRELKLYCVKADTPLMHFVVNAIAEKLKRDGGRRRER